VQKRPDLESKKPKAQRNPILVAECKVIIVRHGRDGDHLVREPRRAAQSDEEPHPATSLCAAEHFL